MLRATSTVGFNTLLSRILGFVRDMVVARTFGAGTEADAFFVAFRIPNLFRRMSGEGAFNQAFVPVLSQWRNADGDPAVRDLSAHVSGALGLVLLVITALGILAAPALVWLFAPGFGAQPDKFELTVQMLRLCFPYLLFISLTALCGGILNTYGRFAVPAFTPVLLNLCLIAAALFLAPHLERPVLALAVGVFVAGVVQLAFQLPFLASLSLLVRPRLSLAHAGLRRVGALMLPALIGVSVTQINILINTVIASFLQTGSVSWLYYSDRIMEFPLGVFGIALATVILPSLSRQHAEGAPDTFARTLDWALRLVVIVALPAALGLALLAAPILSTLFQHGAFTAADVDAASLSLMAFAFGLPGFVAVKVLAPGYFARQDTRTPVKIAAVAVLANLAFNALLVPFFAHAGLALATAGAAWVNAALLLRGLARDRVHRPESGWAALVWKVALANLVMAAFLLALRGDTVAWTGSEVLARIGWLVPLVVGGVVIYAAALAAMGLRPRHLAAPPTAQG